MTTICNRKPTTAVMTSMMSGKKRKMSASTTSFLTTIPRSDAFLKNTFHQLVETTSSSTKKSTDLNTPPSSSSIRLLLQKQQKQKKFPSQAQESVDCETKQEEEAEMKRRLAHRKKRFQLEKRVTKHVTTVTNAQTANEKHVDPLYRPLSSTKSPKPSDTLLEDTVESFKSTETNKSPPALVGRNTQLEKPYLRLTTFADPDQVRPLPVLVKSFAHIKSRYSAEEDFEWANEQLKSLRQDLTVQRLQNPFVLEVYETHARMLLEHGDLNEFNQCQTVIRNLCGRGEATSNQDEASTEGSDNGKAKNHLEQTKESADEFGGYALLYALVRNSWLELNQTLQQQQEQETERENNKQQYEGAHTSCYQHALCVVRSVIEDDTVAFFRLYAAAPHMSAYLMDFLVNRVRRAAYLRAIAAYRPNVGTEQFREWLRFDDLEQTRQFLKQQGAVFLNVNDTAAFWVDCKASHAKFNSSEHGSNKRRKPTTIKVQCNDNCTSSTMSSCSEDTD